MNDKAVRKVCIFIGQNLNSKPVGASILSYSHSMQWISTDLSTQIFLKLLFPVLNLPKKRGILDLQSSFFDASSYLSATSGCSCSQVGVISTNQMHAIKKQHHFCRLIFKNFSMVVLNRFFFEFEENNFLISFLIRGFRKIFRSFPKWV